MKIEFIKDFGCANFGSPYGDFYKSESVIVVTDNKEGFDKKTMISKRGADVAIDNGYAVELLMRKQIHEIKEPVKKVEYENKMITPDENKVETEKEKNARKMREYRAKKKGKKKSK